MTHVPFVPSLRKKNARNGQEMDKKWTRKGQEINSSKPNNLCQHGRRRLNWAFIMANKDYYLMELSADCLA